MAIERTLEATAATSLMGNAQAIWAPKAGDPFTLQLIEAANGGLGVAVFYDYRGNPVEYDYPSWTGAAGVSDNDLVYTSPDVSLYNTHYIECTAGTVDIEVTLDGTNWNTTPAAVLLHDATAVGTYAADIASGKLGQLKMKVKKFRVRQKGATAANARGASGVV